MKLLSDGKLIAELEPEQLKARLGELSEELRKENKVIERLDCDDKGIDVHKLDALDFSAFRQINAISKPINLVMEDALKEVHSGLVGLIGGLQEICSLCRQDKIPQAVADYNKLLPLFRLFILGLVSVRQHTAQDFNLNFEELSLALGEASGALKDNDYITFTDIIEYRVIPPLENLLDSLSARFKEGNSRPQSSA